MKKDSAIRIATVFRGPEIRRFGNVERVQEFAIRFDRRWLWIFLICGLVPRWSRVTVDRDRVAVRMSYGFSSLAPIGDQFVKPFTVESGEGGNGGDRRCS